MDNQNVMENEAMFGEDTALPAYDESYDSDGSGVDVGSALIGAGIAAAIGGVTYVTKKFVAPKVKTKLEEHKAKRAEKKQAKEAKKERNKLNRDFVKKQGKDSDMEMAMRDPPTGSSHRVAFYKIEYLTATSTCLSRTAPATKATTGRLRRPRRMARAASASTRRTCIRRSSATAATAGYPYGV